MSRPLVLIHGNSTWEQFWHQYLATQPVSVRSANLFATDAIEAARTADAVLCRVRHAEPRELEFTRNILSTIEDSGKYVYPNRRTAFHYDDKVIQKFVLDQIDAPSVKTWVFFDKNEALQFARLAEYPLVFKLRRGAAAANVVLVKDRNHCIRLISRMFGRGISPAPPALYDARQKLQFTWRSGGLPAIYKRLKKAPRFFRMAHRIRAGMPSERGYVYFQEFIPNNNYDYRVKIIGNKCWSFRRGVRPGDFRASGSGIADLNPASIPKELVLLSFDLYDRLKMQSVAFDFIVDSSSNFRLVEISYTFGTATDEYTHHWDRSGNINLTYSRPEQAVADLMLKDLLTAP